MKTVSIIIVTYNSEKYIQECINSIKALSYNETETIVVDNNSADNTVKVIEKNFNVVLIKTNINLGFSEGCNLGLKHSSGEFIALINPDAIVDKQWLMSLLKYATQNEYKDVGIFASKIININRDKPVLDSTGDGFSTLLKGYKIGENGAPNLREKVSYVFGACAGAALYRRKMLEEIGFLDEDFFLIHEDTDLNFRAQLAGWKALYVPTAIVYHNVRSSIGHMSDIAVYYSSRNSELVKVKNVPFGIFLGCLPWVILGTISEFFYFAIKHKRFRLYFKAKMDALRMVPKMLRKRKNIMKNRKVSNNYIRSIMTSVWQKDFRSSKIRKLIYT